MPKKNQNIAADNVNGVVEDKQTVVPETKPAEPVATPVSEPTPAVQETTTDSSVKPNIRSRVIRVMNKPNQNPNLDPSKTENNIEKQPGSGNNNVTFVKPPVRPELKNNTPRQQVQHQQQVTNLVTEQISGALEIMPDGQGFVRPKFNPGPKDAYLGSMQIRRYGLRAGDIITGIEKAPKDGEKYWGMIRIDRVNGMDLNAVFRRPDFKDLVPVYPHNQVKLETDPEILSTRIIDLFSPIGFGQRGMIVSPPKAGKTTLLKEIAAGVSKNYPNVHLMAVLVGERPEEVTDMQRFIKGEVIASSFDQKPEEQTRAAEIAMERAKRLVELGKDVFIVFDSITRLARAYNLAIPTSGRTLSGGFDPAALYPSKKFFGAARKIENGGSLTIIGTALVDTGSKMDDLIFEEFKGTGNMELRLERGLAERRIFPAFDILKSGTRKEELLLDPTVLARIISIRRMFDALGENGDATEMIIGQMMKTKSNEEFLGKIGKK
jgi:transcription termination factor Rho